MIEQISENVYAETGIRGCNHSFVITTEGVVMIDTPQYPTDAVKWRDEIAKFGPVRYIINTEPHADHYAGNSFFEGTIIAHEGTRQSILNNPVESYLDMVKQNDPPSLPFVKIYRFRPPTITLTEKMTIYLGKHTFQLTHFPGHTPFQVPVYVPEEKVLFTSDNVVNNVLPFITPMALPLAWIESLVQMQNIDAKILVPGHGKICDKTYIPEMIALMKMWLEAVSAAIEKGLSLEEAQDSIDLRDKYSGSPMPPERMVQVQRMNVKTIYEMLKENNK
jgi:cyclase